MKTVTKETLIEQGYKLNPHYWLPGFYYCNVCKKYSLFNTLSKFIKEIGIWRNVEFCVDCETGETRD